MATCSTMRPVLDVWGVWRVLVTGDSSSYYVRLPGHERYSNASNQDYRRWKTKENAQRWIDSQIKETP